MRTHELRHTGDKPFGCRFCEYRSRWQGSMKAHELHLHLEIQLLGAMQICDVYAQSTVCILFIAVLFYLMFLRKPPRLIAFKMHCSCIPASYRLRCHLTMQSRLQK